MTIVEERIYTLHMGKVTEHLSLYEWKRMATRKRILGDMLGYFTCLPARSAACAESAISSRQSSLV